MPLQKTEAVVLKTRRSGETSKIVTLFSQKFGKIKVIAKGSRGLKSHFYGSLEPLNHINVVYYFKENRDLQFLSQADIIQSFEQVKADLKKYALATIFCELIERTEMDQPNPYLFKILIDALNGIDQTRHNLSNYYFWFLLRFLRVNGFNPDFNQCKICRNKIPAANVRFSIENGNFSCSQCNSLEPNAISISGKAIIYLRGLQQSSITNVNSMNSIEPDACETLLLSFLQYHIDEVKYLKSPRFYRQI